MTSFNHSPLAFDDIRPLFEQALAAEKGTKITLPTRSAAIQLRSRMNYYRKMDRRENARVYPPEHHMHGVSVYDRFILRLGKKAAPDETVVYVEKRLVEDLKVEEIK